MTDPVDLLDQLDALREKATPGPWHVGYESCDEFACGHPDYPYELVGPKRTDPSPNFPQYDNLVSEIAQLSDADAALIVAAVNALPALTSVLRQLADLADEWEDDWHMSEAASQIRTLLASLAAPDSSRSADR